MSQNVQPCPAWCQLRGTLHTAGHYADIANVGAATRVVLFQPEKDGVRDKPMARVHFRIHGRKSLMEVNPALAHDIADLMEAVDFRLVPEVAAALRLTYDLTGEVEYEVAPKKEEA